MQQAVGKIFKTKYFAAEWKEYDGKYAQTKIDFSEDCKMHRQFGPDYQNKGVIKGEEYTAVFIGHGNRVRNLLMSVDEIENVRSFNGSPDVNLVDYYAHALKKENNTLRLHK